MTNLRKACQEYHRRVAEINKSVGGANYVQIIYDIAEEFGIEFDVLSEATLDDLFTGPN